MISTRMLAAIFVLDPRSLALFRMGLGLAVCYGLLTLWPDWEAFFGAQGVYPNALFRQDQDLYRWSIHALNDSPFFLYGLFAVHFLMGLCVMVGYRTRLSILICWLLTISLVHRNPMTMFLGRDYALILFLMWAAFLPVNRFFSLDQFLQKKKPDAQPYFSIANIGLVYSLCMIYLVSGWLKIHPSWTTDLTAVQYALHNPDFSTPAGFWLTQFPLLLKGLTLLTLQMERYGILLIFVPVHNPRIRGLLIPLFVLFHLGLMTTMVVDWFALVMITAWAALIPSSWWGIKTVQTPVYCKNTWANGMALLIFLFITVCHVNNIQQFFYNTPKSAVLKAAQIAGLDFPWRLFCPSPPLQQVRYDFIPKFKEETEGIDWKDYQVTQNKNYRWKFLLDNQTPQTMPYLKNYLIRTWNQQYPHRPRITDVDVTRQTLDIAI